MGFINRGSLPQNFVDSASTGMRLPTPEPQYFFAKMAIGSRLSLEALRVGEATAQQFVTVAGGGSKPSIELDEMARAADAYPDAVISIDEFGKDQGDTIKFQRDLYPSLLTGLTASSREHNVEKSISTTGQAIKQEEVPVVLKEYKGPWDEVAGDVRPYAIPSFDAKYRKNKEQLSNLTTRFLRRDYVRWLDRVIRNLFIADSGNSYITLPSGVSAVSSFVTGAGAYISLDQIFRARKTLSDREWARFPNGRYMCVVPTSFNTQILSDVDYRELSKTHQDGRNLLYGYVGSVQDVDIFECTTLATYAPSGAEFTTVNGTAAPTSTVLHEALLFGPGAVGFGTAISDQQGAIGPEVRYADDTVFGTIAKMIWYALHAFQTLDVRGVQRIVYQYT